MSLLTREDKARLDKAGSRFLRRRRQDAPGSSPGTGLFFERELEQIMRRTYEERRPPRNAMRMFPPDDEVREGASSYTHYIKKPTGRARLITNYADDLPRVNITRDKFTRGVRDLGVAYGYSVRDILAAQFAGEPLDRDLGRETRESTEDSHNEILIKGWDHADLWGLLSHRYVPRFIFQNKLDWSTDPDDMIAEFGQFTGLIQSITNDSVRGPYTVALAPSNFKAMSKRRLTDTNQTILSFIRENDEDVERIIQVQEFEGAAPDGSNVAACYRSVSSTIKAVMPIIFRQMSPEIRNLETIVNTMASNGGLYIARPLEVVIAEGV